MPLLDFYNKIRVIEEFDITRESMDIIREHAPVIEELLREQMSKGIDGNNEAVTLYGEPYYKDRTVWFKTFHGSGLGKETGWITNYMTGAFYASLFTITEGTDFFIKSDISYYPKIVSRSGDALMKLTPENLQFFSQNYLIPELQQRFTTRFNGV